ncbi:MAG TPA: methylmalonyl-CoA mutase small subunit [Candidatus Caccoplasma intestinavium]|uniref:Methylmalonyl-CoA mutase small subunit n=1 Tax=Candidatus Caccoplasma intestinavium TaxID=2840716 RepID=A0A9D1GG64_9BACT|nr:methylmalonyl-CoA mutase small subunit [Candidatus Caccoplasma intestinavium]
MTANKEKLFGQFPPISTTEWKDKVIADLKGADFDKKLVWRTNEGFNVQPMYRAENIVGLKTTDSLPGEYPYVRGTKCDNEWLIRQDIFVENPQEANRKALDLLNKGITSLGFQIGRDQITPESLASLLNGINAEKVELNFISCIKNASKIGEELSSYFKKQGIDLQKVKGSIGFDPFKRILKHGRDFPKYADMAEQVINSVSELPGYRVLMADAFMLNNAGSYITQELGFALAWGNEWLSVLTDKGLTVDKVANRIKFNFGISSNYFMEMAKFRAARMLWAQIVSAYKPNCDCASKIEMHAQTSQFNMTIYDAHVNLLRSQTETMSAALAGVNSITVTPFDITYKQPDEFSERIARNQQLLLKEESHFNKIVDPAGGSYYIETLTASIAEEAWKLFLEVEDAGGFYAALRSGFVQNTVNAAAESRRTAIARRKEILLGTNQYPNIHETALDKIVAETGHSCGCHHHEECTPEMPALHTVRGASDFEALRLATEKSGKRPKVFMLTIGNLAMRLARSQFSGNFFGCAGYEIIDNLGFDTVQAGVEAAIKAKADIVVLCSSDEEYATLAPEAYKLLEGKAIFVVAGAPESMEDLKAQGITRFINVRSNVLETLKEYNTLLSI